MFNVQYNRLQWITIEFGEKLNIFYKNRNMKSILVNQSRFTRENVERWARHTFF